MPRTKATTALTTEAKSFNDLKDWKICCEPHTYIGSIIWCDTFSPDASSLRTENRATHSGTLALLLKHICITHFSFDPTRKTNKLKTEQRKWRKCRSTEWNFTWVKLLSNIPKDADCRVYIITEFMWQPFSLTLYEVRLFWCPLIDESFGAFITGRVFILNCKITFESQVAIEKERREASMKEKFREWRKDNRKKGLWPERKIIWVRTLE